MTDKPPGGVPQGPPPGVSLFSTTGDALSVSAPPLRSYEIRRIEASRATLGGSWRQYPQVSEVNGVRYLDEGNGAFTALK